MHSLIKSSVLYHLTGLLHKFQLLKRDIVNIYFQLDESFHTCSPRLLTTLRHNKTSYTFPTELVQVLTD